MFVAKGLIFAALATGLAIAGLACGGSSNADEPPTEQEVDAYCRDVARTADGLQDVRDAAAPIDEVKMQDARADTRAAMDSLDTSSRELEGGSDLLVPLKEDLSDLLELIATPDLISVTTEIQAQIATVQDDINDLEAAGNCP